MTESSWDSCTDPAAMLEWLGRSGKATERKFRLFGCACVRRVWHLLADERSRRAVEVAERYEDERASPEEVDQAAEAADDAAEVIVLYRQDWSADSLARHAAAWLSDADNEVYQVAAEVAAFAAKAAAMAVTETGVDTPPSAPARTVESFEQCRLIRDLFGNPFRDAPKRGPSLLASKGGEAIRLAEAACEHRLLPEGTLDPARLAVLADAVEEAGGDNHGLLLHLRGQGQVHVRGCWAVDVLLGQS